MMPSYQNYVKKHRFLGYGLPFMVMLIGGSFGLRQFTELRYKYGKKKSFKAEDAEKHGIEMNKASSIEEELEKLESSDLDTWENIRGPRPWEDSRAVQDEQRAK